MEPVRNLLDAKVRGAEQVPGLPDARLADIGIDAFFRFCSSPAVWYTKSLMRTFLPVT